MSALLRKNMLIVACCHYSLKEYARKVSSYKAKNKDVEHFFTGLVYVSYKKLSIQVLCAFFNPKVPLWFVFSWSMEMPSCSFGADVLNTS